MEGDGSKMESKGLTGLVTKPFSGRKLVDTISALVSDNAAGVVLIVDDDPQTCQYYRQLVEEALPGHEIRIAGDGTDALRILAAVIPEMVLLDLMLPGEDGFTVLNRIRIDPRTRHVPVVIITGKVLTQADMERLDYTRVVVQSKRILNADELTRCLRRVFDDAEILPQPTSRVVKLAISHIHQSYQHGLTRHALAEEVGVTESYLSKIFHQEVGISPWEYLTRFRINQAKELLFKSDESIAVLAPQVGFDDPAYFSRVFHKYAGVSPQVWRKKAG
jgi:YesN/AraC family two-component response regulator